MGVYIKGMEMPFAGSIKTIVIYPDGTVRTRQQDPLPYTAVPVPPHGRLIDADALENEVQMRLLECNKYGNQFQKPYEVMRTIALAPTIIESEGK